jgi:PadR family transcriptional regulator, regulatory protein PadR
LIVVEGTLYPLLTRVKNEGLLTYKWVESKSGPPRKYYELTPEGKTFLKEMKKTWEELVHAVANTSKNI